MLSKLDSYDYFKRIINENLCGIYQTPAESYNIIKGISDIVYDCQDFFEDILTDYDNYRLDKNKIKKYMNLFIKCVDLTEKNFLQMEKKKLKKSGVKIKKIKILLADEICILTFRDNNKILFIKEKSLNRSVLYNKIISYLNKKIMKENKLCIRRIVQDGKYGFLQVSELVEKNNLNKYYFKSGELLAILYLLCCRDVDKLLFVDTNITNNNFSANNVARHILESSVYSINFLPLDKINLDKHDVEDIKSGFKYVYNIMVKYKNELAFFIENKCVDNIQELGDVFVKLSILNIKDLELQLFLIETKFLKNEFGRHQLVFSENDNYSVLNKKKCVELAERLGEYLIKKSIIGYEDGNISRTWIDSIIYEGTKKTGNIIDNLIALFFIYLSECTQKKYFFNIALEIMQESIDNIEKYSKVFVYDLFILSKIYSISKSNSINLTINKAIKIVQERKKIYFSAKHIMVMLSIYNNIDCEEIKKLIIDLANSVYENLKYDYGSEEVLGFLIKYMNIKKDSNIKGSIDLLMNFNKDENIEKNHILMLLNRLELIKAGYNNSTMDSEINDNLNYIINNKFNNNSWLLEKIINIEVLEYASEILKDKNLKNRCINTYGDMVNEIKGFEIRGQSGYEDENILQVNIVAVYGYSLIRKYIDIKEFLIYIHDYNYSN